MNILFISSGNSKYGISPIIKNQGNSLEQKGMVVTYYAIKGTGFGGYLKNVKPLKQFLKENTFDVVHAHYSLSAFAASLAGAKSLVVSLMGSDVKSEKYFKFIIRLFNKFSWLKIIVKSEDMKSSLGIKDVQVIPNGVDLDKFKPLSQMECKKELGWELNKKQILFAASPNRQEKNFPLAEAAFALLQDLNFDLKVLDNVPNEKMPLYHNAADVVLLTSKWEGSPNVIKEAMACNRPIVATKVGNIKWLFGKTEGCFISSFVATDVAEKIEQAICFRKTNTRERIGELELDSGKVARKIIEIYSSVLN